MTLSNKPTIRSAQLNYYRARQEWLDKVAKQEQRAARIAAETVKTAKAMLDIANDNYRRKQAA